MKNESDLRTKIWNKKILVQLAIDPIPCKKYNIQKIFHLPPPQDSVYQLIAILVVLQLQDQAFRYFVPKHYSKTKNTKSNTLKIA